MRQLVKKYTALFFVLLVGMNLHAQQEVLAQYLETAAQNNPGLQAAFNQYQAAMEVIPQVGALPNPQLSFGYFLQPIETRNGPQQARLSISQMFPWFGTLEAKKNVAAQSAKAQFEVFQTAKAKLFHEVRTAYYDLYVIQKSIHITQENLRILNSLNRLVMTQVETGKTSASDGLRIEMAMADLRNDLALMEENLLAKTVAFNSLLHVNKQTPIDLPDTLWNEDLYMEKESLLSAIKESNHALLAIDYQSEALLAKEKVAKKSGYPSFFIGLDYLFIGETDNAMATSSGQNAIMFPMVGLSIPLYRKQYKAMQQELVYLQQANQQERTEKENRIEVLVENMYKDYRDADRRIQLFQQQASFAMQALRLLESAYFSGNKDFEALLQMERKVLTYRLELEKARADKQKTISSIHYITGNYKEQDLPGNE